MIYYTNIEKMGTKVCKKCEIEKQISEFGIKRKNIDGLNNICKVCRRIEDSTYRKTNKERVNEIQKKWIRNNPNYKKNYYNENRERLKLESRFFYEKNKELYNQQSLMWNKVNREKRKIIISKYKQKPEIKTKENLRHRIYIFLKSKNIIKNDRTFNIVGCSPEYLREYLEKQFVDGMSWENQGKWHIDHKIPLSSAKTEDEMINLCHYTNLQPLWAKDNLKKGNKIL